MTTTFSEGRDLVLTRTFRATPAQVFRAWTDPPLLQQWFAPRPWTVATAQTDVRTGGSSLIVMRNPEGQTFPCHGVYLEVIPDRRLVFTDAFTAAWEPSEKPFMTVILDFIASDIVSTAYTARVRHWSMADLEEHERMGFRHGWALCTEQLADVIARQRTAGA